LKRKKEIETRIKGFSSLGELVQSGDID